MFEIPTTLILGAGASQPYNYPLGYELKERILNSLQNQVEQKKGWVIDLGFDLDIITNLYTNLAATPKSSIDAFLKYQRDEYLDITKIAIVDEISKSESKEKLYPDKDNWYNNFAAHLFDCPINRIGNNIAIISFNYDRSLETSLYYSMMSSYHQCKEPDICASYLAEIPIIHMFGRLDSLPWENKYNEFRKYGETCTTCDLKKLSENIKLMYEINHSDKIAQANYLLRHSEKIYFLGLDLFHNLSNINYFDTNLFEDKDILITAYKLLPAERRRIESFFNSIQKNLGQIVDSKSLNAIRIYNPFE